MAKEKATETASNEPAFYLHELREHSQKLFGVKPEVFDGAVFGFKEIQMTKKEAESRIKAFLNKEVKQ
ncbi:MULTISPECIES: hypothetical protein [Bacillus]|uniref:hypothetical protein n=1 Tax=Bacillaceae TaxID=186817 RepID=UPI00193C6929|nr:MULTISPECIES: hypothetical protein [Bacillus]UAT31966.1 hypothetical protein K7T73_07035 [Bacillus badius]